jgi:putative glutamine amidotransferase
VGPLIGVTGVPIAPGGVIGWRQASVAAPATYLDALRRAGAEPVVLPPVDLDQSEAERLLERFDGLVVVGGGDVDPARYGEETHAETGHVSAERDGFEIPLLSEAAERGTPTLAICRGMQVLNVALGGTLDQHIVGREDLIAHRSPDGSEGVLHSVRVQPGSRLAKAVGTTEMAAAWSHHHQALARVGEGLVAVGWSEDGLLEAVELEQGWMVAIQWHAERTAADDPVQQALFGALVEEVRGG